MLRLGQIARRLIDSAQGWRAAIVLGVATAAVFWSVWYFTKVPCIPHNAAMGLCNPGWLAHFVSVEILALAGGAGITVGGVKGGYDQYMMKNMLNQEREARLQSEQHLRELIGNLRNELQEERQRSEEQRRLAAEDRREAEEQRRLAAEDRRIAEAERRQTAEQQRSAEDERRRAETEWLRQAEEERRLAAEDRAQSIAIQRAMLDTIVHLSEGRNGNGSDDHLPD